MAGGGGSTSSSNAASVSQIDPRLYADWQQFNQQAKDVADNEYQGYDGQLVAGDNWALADARARALQAASMGQGQIGQAASVFNGIANDSPTWFDAQQAQSQGYTPDTAGFKEMGASQIGDVLDVSPETIASQNRQAYTNPYTQQVVDASMADIDRTRQMQMNDNAYAASQSGAFGGSRHGVVDSLTNEAAQRQVGLLSSQLRSQGFDAASGLMATDAATRNAAVTGNADRDLTARAADAQFRQQAGLANQGAENQVAQFNSQNVNAAREYGATAANETSQFNAQQRQAANDAYRTADLAQSGLNLQGAQGLLDAGKQQQDQYLTGAQAMNAAGSNMQNQEQAQLDSAYSQWAERMGYPQKQLDILSQPFGLIPSNQQSVSNSGSKAKSANASFK